MPNFTNAWKRKICKGVPLTNMSLCINIKHADHINQDKNSYETLCNNL